MTNEERTKILDDYMQVLFTNKEIMQTNPAFVTKENEEVYIKCCRMLDLYLWLENKYVK